MAQKTANKPEVKPKAPEFIFGKKNYQLMIASIIIVCIGFLLMIGSTDIYSFRKIVLSPIVVLAGFALGFVAILKK